MALSGIGRGIFPVLAVALGLTLGACSLLSGWNELGGGTCRTCDAGNADRSMTVTDASDAARDGEPKDAGIDVEIPEEWAITCGTSRCDRRTQGCCVELYGNSRCTTKGACTLGDFFLACDDGRQCVTDLGGGPALCCFSYGVSSGSSCQRTCSTKVLCNPADPEACRSCSSDNVLPGYKSCDGG